ncbi:hypothetical protein LXL04_025795 [Taraxacum kok-saghyz]
MAGRQQGPRQQPRRDADRGNEADIRDPRDVAEIARLQQRVRDLELQQEEPGEETESDVGFFGDGDDRNPFGRRHQPQRRYETDPVRNLGMKIDIPDFEGKAQPDDFIDWINTVERVFDLKDIPDNFKVKVVAIKLRKYASLWWEHLKKKRTQEGRSKVETWAKMKKLLCEKFLPVNYRQEAFLEYHNLSQRNSTVEEFIAEFDRLRMRCGADEQEEQVIARFLGALRSEISDVVQLQPYWTFTDVCALALKVERQGKNKNKATPPRFNTSNSTRFPNNFSSGSGGKTGPARTDTSRVPTPAPAATPARLSRCFKCQGIGHFARECPNQQLVTLTE